MTLLKLTLLLLYCLIAFFTYKVMILNLRHDLEYSFKKESDDEKPFLSPFLISDVV